MTLGARCLSLLTKTVAPLCNCVPRRDADRARVAAERAAAGDAARAAVADALNHEARRQIAAAL